MSSFVKLYCNYNHPDCTCTRSLAVNTQYIKEIIKWSDGTAVFEIAGEAIGRNPCLLGVNRGHLKTSIPYDDFIKLIAEEKPIDVGVVEMLP